ncbi:MAG TPA: LLM class flavin-dependent oxidoreductase, partial [Chloroflexota bacterium]|nr:LLM class flavin-dependent oxidoreductase [Chloroflexota bacterium]
GWNPVEYEALGMSFTNRARRFEEQIALMRRLWTEPVVTFEGRYHRVTAAGLNPMPVQRPIPLWVGGSAEPALKRAAEIADGYFPQRPLEGGWAATIEKMRAWRQAAGKSRDGFGIEARINAGGGTPDDWRRAADEWRRLGATHLEINTMGGGLATTDDHVRRLREAKAALG